MKTVWIKNKKEKSIVTNKLKKESITTWSKPPKNKIVKNKIDKKETTTRNKAPKEKMTNKNKNLQSLQDIINRIESGTTADCEKLVEKFTPRTDKRDYKLVAYQSRGLDPEWDTYRFCEVTMELTGRKVNAEEIHHCEGREGSKYNDPNNLIFVCRKEHDRIHQYETKWLKGIVQKYLVN